VNEITTPVPLAKPSLNPILSWRHYLKFIWLPDDSRSMGIHIMAGKGSGKSRMMGRMIAWLDFVRGIPQVIFDPHGTTIENFLDKVANLPREMQVKAWPRIMYVDMSGRSGYVVPFPLYYRIGIEGLYEVSQRFLDVVRKIDPFLQTASIEGWNPLWRAGTYTGMLLSALGMQITEAEHLLVKPGTWRDVIGRAVLENHDLEPAAEFLNDLDKMDARMRNRKIESFINKVTIFSLDPTMRAMFGSSLPGVDWYKVMMNGTTVLFDFRHEHDLERRRFKMVWAFNYFLDFIKHREAGRHKPIGLIIDELTSLFSLQALSNELFGADLDELINVIARNYSIWLTIAHQEMFQLTERIMKSLMTMGTQILGVTTDPDAAIQMARIYDKYKPYWVKKYIPTWSSVDGRPVIVDYTTEEFKLDEQIAMHSWKFINQNRFQFLIKPASGEGCVVGKLRPVSIENFDRGLYPDQSQLQEIMAWLSEKNGLSVDKIIHEIQARHTMIERARQISSPRKNQEDVQEKGISIWEKI